MRRSRLGFSLGCTLTAAAVLPVPVAGAADALASGMSNEKTTIGNPGTERVQDFCAAYGAGFVRLHGTDTCVKIFGHLRLDMSVSPGTGVEWGTADFGPAPNNAEPIRSHVRLNDSLRPARFQ